VDGKEYDAVCSGTYAPFLKKSIGMLYLPINKCEIGTEFQVGIRNKMVTAKVVELPFYKREK
jgi:aminomethyltransferase